MPRNGRSSPTGDGGRSPTRADRNGEASIPVDMGTLLSVLDKDMDGRISMAELRRNVRQLHLMRKMTLCLTLVVIILMFGMLGAAYTAMETAKEIRAREGLLVDGKGEEVAVYQKSAKLDSLGSGGRRLQLSGGSAYQLTPEPKICEDLWKQYTKKGRVHYTATIDPDELELDKAKVASSVVLEAGFADEEGYLISGRIETCVGSFFWVTAFDKDFCEVNAALSSVRRLEETHQSEEDEVAIEQLFSRSRKDHDKDVRSSLESSMGGAGRGLQGIDKCIV
mmetsp:Transcript_22786/g.50370  ORF Transcript_22786/g.50370 Transcript_22786/m.50370 type:complete len:280 (+) Transcript_22786:38-877(+)